MPQNLPLMILALLHQLVQGLAFSDVFNIDQADLYIPHDNWKIIGKSLENHEKNIGTSAFLAFWHFYQGHIASILQHSMTFSDLSR